MSRCVAWNRLVRYQPVDSSDVRLGEPVLENDQTDQLAQLAETGKLKVEIMQGSSPLDATPTAQIEEVGKLLGPLTPKDVSIIRCIGLNYNTHSALPSYPYVASVC